MTTEQPDPALPYDRPVGARHLRRRTSDRVIGGVAGGLGDYFNVDPILLRVGFAGLMIFGGAGLVLYVLGWLLVPAAGQEDSIVEATVRRIARRFGRLGPAALVLLAIIVVSPGLTGYGGAFYIEPAVFWALAVAAIGIVLLLPRDQGGAAGSAAVGSMVGVEDSTGGVAPSAWTGGAVPGGAAAAASAASAAHAARIRERSPLGWYVLAGALLVLGGLGVIDTVATVRVLPGQYFGGGLLALGIGLVIGAWWGRARLLILLGLVILPAAAVSSFLTVPLEGGLGDHAYRPQSLAEAQAAYHLGGGRLTIDLTGLEADSEPVVLEASVGIGDLFVIVPKDATVEVTGAVQGGRLVLLGREHVGTGLADRVSEAVEGAGGTLVLTLDAGIGQIWVERSTQEGS